jgi:hypothetical protein
MNSGLSGLLPLRGSVSLPDLLKGAQILFSVLAAAMLAGCGAVDLFQTECDTPVPAAPARQSAPIQRALYYLASTQLQVDQQLWSRSDYAGDWPQCFTLTGRGLYVRDVSPFMAAFIHHALALVNEANAEALGVAPDQIAEARGMRRKAIQFMGRFQTPPDAPGAGTFGFWPRRQPGWLPGDILLGGLFSLWFGGPRFMGNLEPLNISFFPPALDIVPDADVTSTVYAALRDHADLDGGLEVTVPFERFFADWRDTGQVPRRNNPSWLEPASGAFLTWLPYDSPPAQPAPNDVDIVVNADVLFALGRFGRLDTAGVRASVAMINTALQSGALRTDPADISLYYPDNLALHYTVTRAWREGGVSDLAPSVELLLDNLLATVAANAQGQHFWDRGDPHLNTAFGMLALMNADVDGKYEDIIDGAADFLIAQQDPTDGSWDAGAFFVGRSDNGAQAVWSSKALTTAMALEALCRQRLGRPE